MVWIVSVQRRTRNPNLEMLPVPGAAKWKGFDLMMLWQGATGAEVYIETWSGLVGNFLKSDYDKRWTPEKSSISLDCKDGTVKPPALINNDNTYIS